MLQNTQMLQLLTININQKKLFSKGIEIAKQQGLG
jgi:hypothetical protein